MKMKCGKIGLAADEKVRIVGQTRGFQWNDPKHKTYIVEDSRGNRHRVRGDELKGN